jgi:hypothetical protein
MHCGVHVWYGSVNALINSALITIQDGAYLCGSNIVIDQSTPSCRDTRAQAPPASGLPKAERHSFWLTILFALPLTLFLLAFALLLLTFALFLEEEEDILPRSHWALHASETFVVCSLSSLAALLLQAGLYKFELTRLTRSMRRLEAECAILEDCDIRLDTLRLEALR